MRKKLSISIVYQVATLLIILTTGLGPSIASLGQESVSAIDVVVPVAAEQDDSDNSKQPLKSEQDSKEVISSLHATLPVAPLHIHVFTGISAVSTSPLKIFTPNMPRQVAPATRVYFKTLFRRIISPNAP